MKRTLTLLFLAYCLGLSAQNRDKEAIDSLTRIIVSSTNDSIKADLLGKLSHAYHTIDPDQGIKHGTEGYTLALELKLKGVAAQALNALGNNYQTKSDYPKALEFYFKALKVNEEINNDEAIAQNLGNIGIVYKALNDYANALEYYHKAIAIFEKLQDRKSVAINLGNAGIIYNIQKDYPKALEYQSRALEINKSLNNKKGMAYNLGNIGLIYANQADYNHAQEYVKQALALNRELDNKKSIANNLRSIGSFYYDMALNERGNRKTNLEKAEENLGEALKAAQEIGDLKNLQEINFTLAQAYELSGNPTAALAHFREHIKYRDSVFSAANAEKITGLITQRELDIRDRDILIKNKQIELDKLAVDKKRNERVLYISGIVLLLLIIAIIIRNFRNQVRSNTLLKAEKRRSDELLLNILPSETAEELKKYGKTAAKSYDLVTVLFADFKGFTTVAEKMTPEELVTQIDRYFQAFDEITARHGLEKIKTIGDAYLCVGGLPDPTKGSPENVVRAAMEMQQYITGLKLEKTLQNLPYFEARIGIHTGPVVAGVVGIKKFAYDIWGDTVNTAARMEQNSEPGKINISSATYELIKNRFACIHRGRIEAKNKGEIDMYFVEKEMKVLVLAE
jgi:class 3 adenylate cyclase